LLITNLRYLSYSLGAYENGKYEGITLQFVCNDTGDDYHVHFNVDLVRQRSTKNHKKGSPLPKGHFTPRPKSRFMEMWRSTSLPVPRSLTSFHDCMGKLKSIVFMAEVSKGTRLDAGTLRPMSLPDNSLITTRQLPDKNLITFPDKDINQSHTEPAQEKISTKCPNNYVISKQVSEYTSNPISPIDDTKRVQNQTNEEWLAEYEEQWALECDELF
jgi:hypothetical protein